MLTEGAGLSLTSFAVEVVLESLVYGVFFVLALVAIIIGAKQEWRTRQAMITLSMISIMLALSTTHWVIDMALFVRRIITSSELVSGKLGSTMTAIARINYAVADAVLVWRAWVICRHEYSKMLLISLITSVLTLIFVAIAIALRSMSDATLSANTTRDVDRGLNYVVIGTLVWSAATNILTTFIIGVHVWRNRAFLRDNIPSSGVTRSIRILWVVTVSGWLYSAYVCFVITVMIYGAYSGANAIGSIASIILIHVSGAYPTFVIALAKLHGNATSAPVSLQVPRETPTHIRETPLPESQPPSSSFTTFVSPRSSLPHVLSPLRFSDFGDDASQALRADRIQSRRRPSTQYSVTRSCIQP